ncbi:hypothetical protein [Francisella frigiditurris]|uniref:Prepilin-type N-terminal cleavage/methylation domain protein n=1 Tax=Francisella frigiditurris TaxID=1542390 RepID=A0A1J0KVQ1_9GAMM|nr:hypothetical protein [Francisella frigiditurris]APC97686.1 hypothetical protein KX01_231 [Francisella frigiditurris]
MFLKNKGFTIVELLIASLITIITVGISVEVYLAAKKDFTLNELELKTLASANETQVALSSAIVNAGFNSKYGLFSWHDIENITEDSVPEFGHENNRIMPRIYIETVGDSISNSILPENAVAGTDYILLQGSNIESTLTDNTLSGSNELGVSNDFASQLAANDYVIIGSAIAYTLGRVSSIADGKITLTNNLKWSVYSGDYIGRYQPTVYYIGNSSDPDGELRVDENGQQINSLFSFSKNNNSTQQLEIIDNISNMQITLHKLGTGNADSDWKEPSVFDTDEVRYRKNLFNQIDAMRIQLTINGENSNIVIRLKD